MNTMAQKALDIDYDIEDRDLEKAREVTIKCNGKRFRIFLEVVTSCFGNCTGCSLSYSDRRKLEPEMPLEQIQKTLSYFVPIINKKEHLRTTVLNLGTGDYFLMSNEFLESLFKSVRIFFDQLDTPRNVLNVSTSLFLSEAKMLDKIDVIKKHLHETQFAIEGVVDPLLLEVHYERYVTNYRALIKHFPFFDLVVNISNGVNPSHIKLMAEFLKEMGILNFDLQYAINNTNTYRVKTSQENFNGIMNSIYEVLGSNTKNILELSIAMPSANKLESDTSIFDEMKNHAKEIVRERVMVKPNGDIFPIGYGYGDILLDERFDFQKIGTIYEPYDEEKAANQIFNYLKNLFLKNKACHTCEYNKLCYSTGYAFYNKFNAPTKCENVGRIIFEKYQK